MALALLIVESVATYELLHIDNRFTAGWSLYGWLALAWGAFALAATAVRRAPRRVAVGLILVGGVGLQILAISVPATSSNDHYRYAWDGRVQAAGIDPYAYSPVDPVLTPLRDDLFFPPGRTCPEVVGDCPILNHPTAHTIYPPVAEGYFYLVHEVGPSGSLFKNLQVVAAALAVGVTVALLLLSRTIGMDPRRAALWAWCPLVAVEAGNNAHVDVLAALLVVVALALLSRGRAIAGGLVIGLSIATKLLPVLLIPSVIRRRPVAVLLAAAGATMVVYLPHVIAVGSGVLGFLPGYVDEEAGSRFALLAFLPDALISPVAILVVAVTAYLAWSRTDPTRPWITAAATVGVVFLVLSPNYPWYALLLVPLVAMGAHAIWLLVPVAMTTTYYAVAVTTNSTGIRTVSFAIAAVAIAATLLTANSRSRERLTAPTSQ